MADAVDRKILHALQCAPRASFRRIGEAAGVSEQTAARRYHALRRSGVMRIAGLVSPAVYGQAQWVARIRCLPHRLGPFADSLARRPDITYANLTSGGSEVMCIIRSPIDSQREELLLRRLPSSASVTDATIELLLHPFDVAGTAGWTGYGAELDSEQVRRLVGDRPPPLVEPVLPPTDEDAPLLAALAEDGRATHARLATLTGWSKARVTRRLQTLERSGTLIYEVDLLPERLGYHLNATLWLRVAPAQLQRIGEELAQHDEVAFAGATSGHHNIMAIVICRSAEDLYRYLTTRIATVAGINSYEVSVRVRRLKQAASLVSHGRLIALT